MSWVKIDDHANEHRKQVAAGPVACWLWACGLMYANRQPTRDGFIPVGVVSMLFAGANKKLAEKLVEVGLWEATDGGYRVHDYHDYQPTQEETDERRSRRVERARKGAAARWSKEPSIAQASPKHDTSMRTGDASSIAPGMLADAPDPDPDPVPDKNRRPPLIPPVGGEAKSAKVRASRAPGSDAPADEVTAWRERWKLGDAEPVEFAKFLDFHRAKGSLMADWGAAWRNWRRNAATFARGSRAPGRTVQPVDMTAPWMAEGYGETLGKEGTG